MERAFDGWLVGERKGMSGWKCLQVDGGKGRARQSGRAVGTHLGEEVRITHNYLCLVKAVWEGRSG